jgi:hypothetical protein
MQIIAHGATVNGPIDILFAAYMVVPCHNFRSYIKCKEDAYTDGTLTLTHKELIMLATNKFNLLKQEGTWGAKTPDEDKIVAIKQNLPLSSVNSNSSPSSRRSWESRLTTKEGIRSKVETITKEKRTRRTMPTRESRRRMKIGRRPLQRRKKLTRRK